MTFPVPYGMIQAGSCGSTDSRASTFRDMYRGLLPIVPMRCFLAGRPSMRRWTVSITVGAALLTFAACDGTGLHGDASVAAAAPVGTSVQPGRVVNVYPHDPQAFTQGLLFQNGVLLESTGLVDTSSL